MKTKILSFTLALILILFTFVACGSKSESVTDGSTEGTLTTGTEAPTQKPTEEATTGPSDPPVIPEGASLYSGKPDTSWYTGDKTEYTLTSADQLMGMMQLRENSSTDNPLTFEGITIKLGCDMVFNPGTAEEIIARAYNNHQWPELHSARTFNGTLDGQGHMISGIYMSIYNSGFKGIFGCSDGNVTVKDLTVCNSYVGTGTASTGVKEAIGGLFGRINGDGNQVTFSNVTVDLILEERDSGYRVNKMGGFVGALTAKNSNVTLENCKFLGKVTSTGDYAGGLVGYLSGASMDLTVKNCENTGDITAKYYAGGIAGQMTVKNLTLGECKSAGTIKADGAKGALWGIVSVTNDPMGGARPSTPEGCASLRVMSYNIRFNLPKDASGNYTQIAYNRINATKQEILSYNADIIGIQEDRRDWASFLIFDDYKVIQDISIDSQAELTSLYYKKGMNLLDGGTIWLTDSGTTSEINAIKISDLFKEGGKYQMTAEELALLRITKDTPDSYLGQALTDYIDYKTNKVVACKDGSYRLLNQFARNATYGVFNVDGQIIIAINTHLQQRTVNGEYSNDAFQKLRENERLKQLELLKKFIDEQLKKYPDAEIVMTGDWNDTPFSNVYNVICNDYGFANVAFSTENKYGVHGSSNSAFDNDAGHTDNSAKEGGFGDYLDYVFVTDGFDVLKVLTGDGKETVTLPDGSKQVVYTSDHLPQIADLCFKKGSQSDVPDTPADDQIPDGASVYSGTPDTSWYDEANPKSEYVLTTADQLMGWIYLRNQSKGAINFDGITIKLGCDMVFNTGTAQELSEKNSFMLNVWPMLTSTYAFKGTLDGQGHTVYGVYMKLDSGAKGVVGTLDGNAKIQNISFLNTCILGPDVSGKQDIGFLTGKINKGADVTISNVTIDGLFKEGTEKVAYVGGFIGQVDGEVKNNVANSAKVTLINCEFKGTIECGEKSQEVGGFIGRAMRASSITLTGCTFSGEVKGTYACGSLVGYANSNADRPAVVTDTDCTYTGTVNGTPAAEAPKKGR